MQPQPSVKYAQVDSTAEFESRSANSRLPLARLLQLLMILQSERFPNARRLAEACAVSRRTIYRDLGLLDTAGIAVLYRPDRQGYELVRGGLLQPLQLEEKEALALLIVSRMGCSDDPFGFSRHARCGLAKVVQALPEDLRDRISCSSELIAEETAELKLPPDRPLVYETILGCLSRRQRLHLWYSEKASSQVVDHEVEPLSPDSDARSMVPRRPFLVPSRGPAFPSAVHPAARDDQGTLYDSAKVSSRSISVQVNK